MIWFTSWSHIHHHYHMIIHDYHINHIKRAKEVTPDGLADTYEQLQTQIGLPNDACANSQRSSMAQLRIK